MVGNEDSHNMNMSNTLNLQYYDVYKRLWNESDASTRNFFVNPNTLEVRSQYWDHMTVVPILATIMLVATVFLLVLFRHSPSMVAGTVAACLTMIAIYLILNSLNDHKLKFE